MGGMPIVSVTPLGSTKGVTGHALGAAGGIEAVAMALTLERGVVPPTRGTEQLDEAVSIDIVLDAPRPWTPTAAMSNSFGFGGHNGTIVMGAVSR
jgi:3-oxoacyl-[acyl-carrier-protein] synthase II